MILMPRIYTSRPRDRSENPRTMLIMTSIKTIIWIISITTIVIVIYQRSARSSAFRHVAEQLALKYSVNALPKDLILTDISFFNQWDSVSNVMTGKYQNHEVAVFDFNANHGDIGYKQTVIAVKSHAQVEEISNLWKSAEIECEKANEWTIMYRMREELPVKLIPQFLVTCMQLVDHFESK
jgi:hypothetical protein